MKYSERNIQLGRGNLEVFDHSTANIVLGIRYELRDEDVVVDGVSNRPA